MADRTFITNNLPKPSSSTPEEQRFETKDVDNEKANEALEIAKNYALVSTPIITKIGLEMMFHSGHDDFGIGTVFKMLGLPVAVGGIVLDTIKFPITGTISLGALFWGTLLKIKSLFTKESHDEKQIKEITNSFMQRFGNTIRLLVGLKLETAESINDSFQNYFKKHDNNGLEALCALTTLNTAYASRALSSDSVLLANGKVLHKKHCPKEGLEIFNLVVKVKNSLRQLGLHQKSNREATPMIIKWIPLLKSCLESKDKISITNSFPDKMEVPDFETCNILDKIIRNLKQIGKNVVNKKPLDKNSKYMHKSSLQGLPKEKKSPKELINANKSGNLSNANKSGNLLNANKSGNLLNANKSGNLLNANKSGNLSNVPSVFIDKKNKNEILDAVVADNGYLYNRSTAEELLFAGDISRYYLLYSANGPKSLSVGHEDFKIDPITCEEIENLVICNDGRFYDRDTANDLIRAKLIGVGGILIENYIECPYFKSWPTKKN